MGCYVWEYMSLCCLPNFLCLYMINELYFQVLNIYMYCFQLFEFVGLTPGRKYFTKGNATCLLLKRRTFMRLEKSVRTFMEANWQHPKQMMNLMLTKLVASSTALPERNCTEFSSSGQEFYLQALPFLPQQNTSWLDG